MHDRQQLDTLTRHAREFDTAMLVTGTGSAGAKRARPMILARVDDDGTTYFPVSAASGQALEVAHDPQVGVVLQDDDCYVSISGRARLTRDPGLVQQLWSEDWRTWFEDGMKDPDLRVLEVTPHIGEFWSRKDETTFELLWEAAKKAIGGDPEKPQTEHAKVAM